MTLPRRITSAYMLPCVFSIIPHVEKVVRRLSFLFFPSDFILQKIYVSTGFVFLQLNVGCLKVKANDKTRWCLLEALDAIKGAFYLQFRSFVFSDASFSQLYECLWIFLCFHAPVYVIYPLQARSGVDAVAFSCSSNGLGVNSVGGNVLLSSSDHIHFRSLQSTPTYVGFLRSVVYSCFLNSATLLPLKK